MPEINPLCRFCYRFGSSCKGEEYLPEYCMSDAIVVIVKKELYGRFNVAGLLDLLKN